MMFDVMWREKEAEIEGGVGRFEFKGDKMKLRPLGKRAKVKDQLT